MYGITNASKGIQSPADVAYVDAKAAAAEANAILASNAYTDAHKGYGVTIVSDTSSAITTSWNTEVRITNNITSATVVLPSSPDLATDAQTHELRVIVKFGSGTPSLTFRAASGQIIKWPDDEPTWSTMANKLFEISFSPIYSDGTNVYIVAYGKEIDLA